MAKYDEDIDKNPYLPEHGKYALQFAKNHDISVKEAYRHPTVIAHKEALNHLKECFDFYNGNINKTDI